MVAEAPFGRVRDSWRAAVETPESAKKAQLFDAALAASPGNARLVREAVGSTVDPARLASLLSRLAIYGAGLPDADVAPVLTRFPQKEQAHLRAVLRRNLTTIARSTEVAKVGPQVPLVEGVAYDEKRDCYYLSSVAGRGVFALCGNELRQLPFPNAVGPVLGLAFDGKTDRLWFVSDPLFGDRDGEATGLHFFDVSASILTRVPSAAGLHLGDVALGKSAVYAADSRSGAVYRSHRGGPLELLLPPGLLRSAQGMAESADGRYLYVADYAYGLSRIDLRDGSIIPVATAHDVALDGIDGLMRYGDDLIAIQNGWSPARIVRLKLSSDGRTVEALSVIDRAHPSHEEPTQGDIIDDRLIYVANSQWGRYNEDGRLRPGMVQAPTTLLSMRLGDY